MAERPEYKSKWTGQQVDDAVGKIISNGVVPLTTADIVQTTGVSPTKLMSQGAITRAIEAPIYEKKQIDTYIATSGISPFSYTSQVTIDTVLEDNSTVELINDNPIAFANYCFNIGEVSGQVLTIYMIKNPINPITLTFGIRG